MTATLIHWRAGPGRALREEGEDIWTALAGRCGAPATLKAAA